MEEKKEEGILGKYRTSCPIYIQYHRFKEVDVMIETLVPGVMKSIPPTVPGRAQWRGIR